MPISPVTWIHPKVCRAHAYHYRGRVYQWYKHEDAKAIADYTESLRLDPDVAKVLYRRGQAYHSLKQYAEADKDFAAAFELDPNYHNLLKSWAWQLATCPDAKYRDAAQAVELAKRSRHLDTLAAAYAESGEFDDAVATQIRAIEGLGDRNNQLKQAMQIRLTLYEARQPYREE